MTSIIKMLWTAENLIGVQSLDNNTLNIHDFSQIATNAVLLYSTKPPKNYEPS